MKSKYKLIPITEEEYVMLGDAGGWVVSDGLIGNCMNYFGVSESEFRAWNRHKYEWAKLPYRYTRVELD